MSVERWVSENSDTRADFACFYPVHGKYLMDMWSNYFKPIHGSRYFM